MNQTIDLWLLFINSLFIFGLHYALGEPSLSDNNILTCKPAALSWIPYQIYKHFSLSRTALKPFYLCPVCMSSVWSTPFYWFHSPVISYDTLFLWPVYITCLAGITRLLKSFT